MNEDTRPDDDSYIVRVKAVVMTRDDSSGGWLAQDGLSRVGVCRVLSAFLIHAERLSDKQVILECFLKKDLVYTKATPTFHHWKVDNRKSGLTFQSPSDARAFSRGVRRAVEDLTEGSTTSSSTLQNEAELGDDDVFTTATDSSSNSSNKREPMVHSLAPNNFCESRRHQCILGHFYDPNLHRPSDYYYMDQAVHIYPRHVSFQVVEEIPSIISPTWFTGYEDYRYGNNTQHSSKHAHTYTHAHTHSDKITPHTHPHHLHHPHHYHHQQEKKNSHHLDSCGGGGGHFVKKETVNNKNNKQDLSFPFRLNCEGKPGCLESRAVVTMQPKTLEQKDLKDTKQPKQHHNRNGTTNLATTSSSSNKNNNKKKQQQKNNKKKDTSGERSRCVYCQDMFDVEQNARGLCREAPDPFHTFIRRVSLLWCADTLLYHCLADSEGECQDDPCSCDARGDERFCARWLALACLSLLAPCMCCYAPLTACHRCGVKCHCCGGRHKAVLG